MEVINLTLISLIGSINLREKKTATTTKNRQRKNLKKHLAWRELLQTAKTRRRTSRSDRPTAHSPDNVGYGLIWMTWPWFIPHPGGRIEPHSDDILVCWELLIELFSQASPIFSKSFLITPLQFVLGRPGPRLYPGTSQCNAWCGGRWWSILVLLNPDIGLEWKLAIFENS